ncbi:MAG: DUF2752 domain-containing protein [Phycisphaerales bacterium]|nr:DUF2752 domain-containing protein [Phycisphaerales bacterium]
MAPGANIQNTAAHGNGRPGAPRRTATRLLAAAQLAAGVAAILFLYPRPPTDHAWIPPCPSFRSLGVYCPGCGSLRATHHLLHARLAEAWRFNPALVALGIPAAAAYAAGLVGLLIRGRWWPRATVPAAAAWALLAAVVLYTIARNLPGAVFEPLRPPDPPPRQQSALPGVTPA